MKPEAALEFLSNLAKQAPIPLRDGETTVAIFNESVQTLNATIVKLGVMERARFTAEKAARNNAD